MNADVLLARMAATVRQAQEALADEREGDFTRAVHSLEADALALADLVRSW